MRILFALSALLLPLSTLAHVSSASVYTSVAVKDCKTISSSDDAYDAGVDYYTGLCRGKSGYTVKISGGDIRYALSLIYKGQEIEFTQIAAFHDMGSEKIEWRGFANANGSIETYHSLIYRLNIADYSGDSDLSRDVLYVVRLNGLRSTCLIGKVEQSAKMNETARKIADDMTTKCLPQQF